MSVNAVDQSTGNTTPLAGNTNNLVGNLSALTTNTKSDAVGAINEVNQTKQNATDNSLQTTDKTIVGGINELKSGLNDVNSNLSSKCPFKVNADNTNPIAMSNVGACVLIWVGGVAQPNIAEMYLYNGFNQSLQTIVGGATPKITPVYDGTTDIVTFNFDNGIMYVIG